MPNSVKDKKQHLWLPLGLTLCLALGFLTGLRTGQYGEESLITLSPSRSLASYKVDEVLGFISQRYVDSVDVDVLAENAIRLIVDSLDPYSQYLDEASLSAYRQQMEGYYVGIGFEYLIIEDTIVVSHILAESPAADAGLQSGDQIITLDEDSIFGKHLYKSNLYEKFLGRKNSSVLIGIRRCGLFDQIKINRSRIQTQSVPIAESVDDSTVYIKINRFSNGASKEFLDRLEPFHEAGKLHHLIIDLRGNPGGYLQEAVKILNQFFDKKDVLLVYTEGLNAEKNEYKSSGRTYLDIDQLYILIDEGSASASEIVAGAVQDLDRGVIVGRRSYGKGTVQEQYMLSRGGSLKLTTAKYFTPSGRSIQKKSHAHSDNDLASRSQKGEWLSINNIPLPDSTPYHTSKGRVVYGSRGIVPDLFVPLDSLSYDQNFIRFQSDLESMAFTSWQKLQCDSSILTSHADTFSIENSFTPELITFYVDSVLYANDEIKEHARSDYNKAYRAHLIEILHRYRGGMTAYYRSSLDHDSFVSAVKELRSKEIASAESLQSE